MVHAVSVTSPAVLVPVSINNVIIPMEIDCGSTISLINFNVFKKHFSSVSVLPSTLVLSSVTGPIKVIGQYIVNISIMNKEPVSLVLVVCETTSQVSCRMGRQWMDVLFPSWRTTFSVTPIPDPIPVQAAKETVFGNVSLCF